MACETIKQLPGNSPAKTCWVCFKVRKLLTTVTSSFFSKAVINGSEAKIASTEPVRTATMA
jgi:hypothetical protein